MGGFVDENAAGQRDAADACAGSKDRQARMSSRLPDEYRGWGHDCFGVPSPSQTRSSGVVGVFQRGIPKNKKARTVTKSLG